MRQADAARGPRSSRKLVAANDLRERKWRASRTRKSRKNRPLAARTARRTARCREIDGRKMECKRPLPVAARVTDKNSGCPFSGPTAKRAGHVETPTACRGLAPPRTNPQVVRGPVLESRGERSGGARISLFSSIPTILGRRKASYRASYCVILSP